MKISVIVPVYSVEEFIERCVRSLFQQTYKEVEYIFVNDHTPDRSMEIIKNCIAEYPHLKTVLLEHSVNKGLPAARNTGLSVATGKYVFHCDSDDFVEPDMLEKLYQRAEETNADIVWCDCFLSFEKNEGVFLIGEIFGNGVFSCTVFVLHVNLVLKTVNHSTKGCICMHAHIVKGYFKVCALETAADTAACVNKHGCGFIGEIHSAHVGKCAIICGKNSHNCYLALFCYNHHSILS